MTRTNALLVASLICLICCACTPARMAISPGLQKDVPLEVKGRNSFKWNEDLSFGPWTVDKVDRGWKTTSGWNILGVSSTSVSDKFEFQLARDGKAPLQAQATTGATRKELGFFLLGIPTAASLEDTSTLAVSFLEQGQTDPQRALRLLVEGPAQGPLSGALLIPGSDPVNVKGTRALQDTPIALSDTSGYTFERGGQSLGAVEVINSGRVWMEPQLSETDRNAIAAASAALLLYRGPELPER